MRQKTTRLIFWGALAVLSSSLLVMAGVWVGEQTGSRGRDQAKRAEKNSDSDFENRLLGKLAETVADADDIEDDERDKAMAILREADPLWSRIKRQNREGLRRANQHPRIVPPKKKTPTPAKKPKSDSPDNNDQPSKNKPE